MEEHFDGGRMIRGAGRLVCAVSGLSPLRPERRQVAPALALLVEALRYRR